jgi:transposase InsO family protein
VARSLGVSEATLHRWRAEYGTAPPNPYRDKLVTRMRELAVVNPRRGRRSIMDLLRKERWSVGARLMKRLWRQEGLLVPQRRVKRRRIGTGENGIVRRRATRRNEVWGMDFVQDRTVDGRPFRMLVVLDEYTRECLAIEVHRHLRGGQRAGDDLEGGEGVVRGERHWCARHRPGVTVAERDRGELQRATA